ncbi:MAG TPA: isoprenylcysteine carboxylmethyltransferase family protein [Bacteroidales bacterium]|nr:isoprenylcysteine carboxylmethyltransferase family protein [Bacteroidales bacterium]
MLTTNVDTAKLKRRTILGFVLTTVIFELLLFGTAGSFNYWQGWLYSIITFVFLGGSAIYLWKRDPALLERRTKVGAVYEKEKGEKIVQIIAVLGSILIAVIPALDYCFGWSHVPLYIVILGAILLIIGYYLVFLVFKVNSFASTTIEVATDQKVISTGPYGVVRHPMYLGALIALVGTPLSLGSWWGLIILISYVPGIIWRLLDEERFLSKNLQGYDEYRQKVRYRLIPLLW